VILIAPEPVMASYSSARRADTKTLHYPTRIRRDCTGSIEAQVRRPVTSRAMIVFMISDVPP
jgi:hypothetical protein